MHQIKNPPFTIKLVRIYHSNYLLDCGSAINHENKFNPRRGIEILEESLEVTMTMSWGAADHRPRVTRGSGRKFFYYYDDHRGSVVFFASVVQ